MPAPFIDLRSSGPALRRDVLALNAAHEAQTAPLDAAALDALLAEACLAPALLDGQAFLIALDATARHDGANHMWVRARHPDALYVDRLVVAAALRGRGLGRALYEEVFAEARRRAVPVACEVNTDPPNPNSEAFHAALGFREIGTARLSPAKAVRYYLHAPS